MDEQESTLPAEIGLHTGFKLAQGVMVCQVFIFSERLYQR